MTADKIIDYRQTGPYRVLARARRRYLRNALTPLITAAFLGYFLPQPATPVWAYLILIPLVTLNITDVITEIAHLNDLRARFDAVKRATAAGIDLGDGSDVRLP